jgi:short-subunit dehydrogenase
VIALVTGASGGIGLELARLFAGYGHDLVLVARGGERLAVIARELEERHRVEVRAIPRDLSNPIAPLSLFDECGEVDFLVNNAGFGHRGSFADEDPAILSEMLQVNVAALTQLTRMFLPAMVDRGSGRILNVASTAAFQPGPLMAVYHASKAYVLSFSEAIRAELDETGVSVTTLCPGPTRTAFVDRAEVSRNRFTSSRVMEPFEVAREGYTGMMAGRAVVIPGKVNRLGAAGARLAPRSLAAGIARRIHEADEPG